MKDSCLADRDTFQIEIITQSKNAKYNDLKYLVFRMELTYHEIAEVLDSKYICAKTEG